MVLKVELGFYNNQKEELLKHYTGQFALIKGRTLVGTYEKFGTSPFLIKPVQEEEELVQFPALLVGAISADA